MGRKLGLSNREIGSLARLIQSEFDYREWVALQYARDYALLGGKEPVGAHVDDFRRLYSEKEQRFVLRIMRQMDFANRVANRFSSGRPDGSCRLPKPGTQREDR